jgi:hypothetical protein
MDELSIQSSCENRWAVQRVLGYFDGPAFVRRALRVREALEHLLERCRQERDQRLTMPRLRLGVLRALAGDWHRLGPLLANENQIGLLKELEKELAPRLRVPVEPTSAEQKLRRALQDLQESLEYFNGQWITYLAKVDRTGVNEAREGYNRYYLLEKECAMGSPRLARQGFQRMAPFTLDDLISLLPTLFVPELRISN